MYIIIYIYIIINIYIYIFIYIILYIYIYIYNYIYIIIYMHIVRVCVWVGKSSANRPFSSIFASYVNLPFRVPTKAQMFSARTSRSRLSLGSGHPRRMDVIAMAQA